MSVAWRVWEEQLQIQGQLVTCKTTSCVLEVSIPLFRGEWNFAIGANRGRCAYAGSSTLDHIVKSALESSSPPAVLFIGDFSYAGESCLPQHTQH